MSYESKIAQARSVLEQHNSRVPDTAKVDVDKFFFELTTAGGTSEEALAVPGYEDLQKFGAPLILAKQIAQLIFRRRDGYQNSSPGLSQKLASNIGGYQNEPRFVPERHAARMNIAELVDAYDPRDGDSAVAKKLREKSKNEPCVVFNSDNSVDKEATVKMLAEIRDGFPARTTYSDARNPVPREIFRIGERPDSFVEISPIFTDEILRPGGEDVTLNRSWEAVPLKTKQLIFLARTQTKEIAVNGLREAIDIHTTAMMDNGFETIASYAPKAAMEYKRLEQMDELPKLRKQQNNCKVQAKNNPFGNNKRY